MLFDDLVERRIGIIRKLLRSKGTEYIRNNDRFHNFKTAARINNESTPKALWGMACKHLVSVMDIIQDTDKGKVVNQGLIDEKIGDMINYLILLEGVLKND